MSDEMILRQASPTLAGLKTGSLFTVPYRSEAELCADVAEMNRRLAPKGVSLRVLRVRRRALLYLYRPSYLSRDFSHAEAASLLRQYGYAAENAEQCLERLGERLRAGGDFPHEIGLFLGYPAEDVRGFIEEKDAFKCVGAWKVYGDAEAARKRFIQFEKCTAAYCKLYRGGKSIERLTVKS